MTRGRLIVVVFFALGTAVVSGLLAIALTIRPRALQETGARSGCHEQGLDVYLNLLTGKEVYIGRAGVRPPLGFE
jgi:hypothetical protein